MSCIYITIFFFSETGISSIGVVIILDYIGRFPLDQTMWQGSEGGIRRLTPPGGVRKAQGAWGDHGKRQGATDIEEYASYIDKFMTNILTHL